MNKKYQIIYADPPWEYKKNLHPSQHYADKDGYQTLPIKDLCALPVGELADNNCALFIWATMPQLDVCFDVIKAWGFEYKTVAFTWVKTNKLRGYYFGLGNWTRANPELCLLAFRGKLKRISNDISQLVISDIMEHSHKPSIIREYILRLLGDLPRIELFARIIVEGWDCWGNEVESDIEL